MKKTYHVRYKMHDGYFGFIETSGENLTKKQTKNRAIDYLEANARPYEKNMKFTKFQKPRNNVLTPLWGGGQ